MAYVNPVLWKYACANQSVTYNVTSWIQRAGSSFLPSSLAVFAQSYLGLKGDNGRT
jgi:hypothetical protein